MQTTDPNKIVIDRLPHDKCGSSDGLVVYADGHAHCYVCDTYYHKYTEGTELTEEATVREPEVTRHKSNLTPIPETFLALADRGISAKAAAKYGITFNPDPTSKYVHVYPYYKNGRHVSNKGRVRAEKDFRWNNKESDLELFGQSAFPAGCAKTLTIVEGECDAAAAFDMNGGFPVVSVESASSALRDIKRNFDYVCSFDEVVICFDKDEGKVTKKGISYPGQEAALKVAEALPVGKVRLLTLSEHKDPNDYLQAGKGRAFVKEWFNAPKFTPASLRMGTELWDEIITVPEYETVSYPWDGLQTKTYGLRLSELVIVNAQQKIGKSTVLGQITHHLLQASDAGIGIMRLEESNRDTALNLMSIESKKRLHLPDVWDECSPEEIRKYYDKTVNTDRIVMWDHFGSNSIDAVLAKIRSMHALGCKYIILDHLSIIVSDQTGDERKQLDELATKIKTLTMDLNICVIAVVHQNRDGQIRGTAGIGQLANVVIRLDRDKEARNDTVRNTTEVTVTDNRFCGDTGLACYLYYDPDTGVLEEMDENTYVNAKSDAVSVQVDPEWHVEEPSVTA